MNNLFSMLPILLVGAALLMAGILINRGKKQSLRSAIAESLGWGLGFLFSFSAEILLLANS
ncbi:MAG TPA: hypothetical protein VFW59_06380 [Gallionella sp.]|nr:hypothetical protein [Gallionella sp.]